MIFKRKIRIFESYLLIFVSLFTSSPLSPFFDGFLPTEAYQIILFQAMDLFIWGKAKYSPTMGKFARITRAACQRPENFLFFTVCWLHGSGTAMEFAGKLTIPGAAEQPRCTAKRCAGRLVFTSGLLLFLAPNIWWATLADLYLLLHKSLRISVSFIFSCVAVGSFKGWPFFLFLSHHELRRKRNI